MYEKPLVFLPLSAISEKGERSRGLAHLTQLVAIRKDWRYHRWAFTKSFTVPRSDIDLQQCP